MTSSLSQIEVITLFVDDIAMSRAFYAKIFARPVIYEDDVSFVIQFENLMVNILKVSEAPELVEPKTASTASNSAHILLTIRVENVDATCETLSDLGVDLLNGPIDRQWGRRTAAFADPSGHVWEIAELIADEEGAT